MSASAKSYLLSLCESQDWDAVRSLLADKKKVKKDQLTYTSDEGLTCLAHACLEEVIDVVELLLDQAPITVSNFIDLANTGFYDGVHFHRVQAGVLAQFGCPNAKELAVPSHRPADRTLQRSNPECPKDRPGMGGPAADSTFTNEATGEAVTRAESKRPNGSSIGVIPDERVARISNVPGTVAMATTGGPNSSGSQFFFNVRRNTSLDWFSPGPARHVVFAMVTDGYDHVVRIANAPAGAMYMNAHASRTEYREMPDEPIEMRKITISGVLPPMPPPAESDPESDGDDVDGG